MFKKTSICLANIVFATVYGLTNNVSARATSIVNLREFYDFYGSDFTSEQETVIEGIFSNIEPYLQPNGLDNAIADGFIPFTPEWIDHGVHWFNPNFVDLTNMQANPLLPSGLNIGQNGELLGVFWVEELYDPLIPVFQELEATVGIANLTPEQLTQLYTQHISTTERTAPTVFDLFSNVGWHQHKNVVIENLGERDVEGNLDPQQVNLRQSLPNPNFIEKILTSLADPDSVLVPLEFDSSLGYPPFNRGVSAGFHMLHMWLGQGNEAGLFAGTNRDIVVSSNAISEATTFEDGSDGHGHGMEGGDGHGENGHGENGHGENSQSVPEPSFIVALISCMLLLVKNKKRYLPN